MMGVSPMIVPLGGMLVVVQRAFRAVIVGAWPVDLDLQGRMPDAETAFQLPLRLGQEAVARMTLGHDEMSGQRCLGRAHGRHDARRVTHHAVGRRAERPRSRTEPATGCAASPVLKTGWATGPMPLRGRG